MARRRVNRMIGYSAGYFGLDPMTAAMVCSAILSGGAVFYVTGQFLPAAVVGTAIAIAFQLVTNGKPGEFLNGFYKRPHWVRAERPYVNEWSIDYVPKKQRVTDISARRFLTVGMGYLLLYALVPSAVVWGLLLFMFVFIDPMALIRSIRR